MKNKEKLFQECMDEGKNYFYKHKNVRPTFMVFYQEMLKYFGEENNNIIEKVYYGLIKNLPATKMFGFDSEQFKDKLNSLIDIEEVNQTYDQEKNKAKELLKALNIYRSEYNYKMEEVYKGKAEYDRSEESVYFKKPNEKSGGYKEERLKYYTEGINNITLIEIFSYEFMSNYSNNDISEKSYAKGILDKIEEEIIIFLSDIKKVYQTKVTSKPTEDILEPIEDIPDYTEDTPEPIEELPEPAEKVVEPIEEILEFTEETLEPIEETPKSTEKTDETNEEILEFTEKELELVKETPELSEVKTKPTKVTPVSESTPDKISIIKEQVDIVRILEAMYSSGIIPAKTEIRQIAQLFYNNQEDIENFESIYNSQKMKNLEGYSESNNEKLKQFIKLLSSGLEKFDIKEIIEHLITISFDK